MHQFVSVVIFLPVHVVGVEVAHMGEAGVFIGDELDGKSICHKEVSQRPN